MPYYDWHECIERGLYDEAERIETDWWASQASLTPPTTPAPIPTRAPRTDTALRIEALSIRSIWKQGKR
jgi:hypothetical protein